MSITPSTSYISLTSDGNLYILRQFGADRLPIIDLNFTHDHGYGMLHVHEYYKGNKRKDGRAITMAERKKYAKIIKRAGF